MTIWVLALILTAIACATLYYAGAGRTVNATGPASDATTEHFRAQLRAIESDADSLEAIVSEMLTARTSERQGRLIDRDEAGSMEKKKREGYF